MNNVTGQMAQAETADVERGNFSYNEDALCVSSCSAVDRTECRSWVLLEVGIPSKYRGNDLDWINLTKLSQKHITFYTINDLDNKPDVKCNNIGI